MSIPLPRILAALLPALIGAAVLPAGAADGPALAPSHVVVVVMENHAASQIVGARDAPYINRLARGGARFTQSYAVTHPSQPNYLALFSGSTQGVQGDHCPYAFDAPNLAQELRAAGRTFVAYSEALPAAGYDGCTAPGGYARKHAPWANFGALPAATHQPFTAFPTTDFESLPTVAFVVPSQGNDMHDGTVAEGDRWLQTHLDPYVQWARKHNALLILTWDEDDGGHGNQILTVFHGPMVRPGATDQRITHYEVLRALEDLYGLPRAGQAATARAITGIW
jgi:acid phosphatase